eukprot:9498316-Pyramimonas_sp.AAC.1
MGSQPPSCPAAQGSGHARHGLCGGGSIGPTETHPSPPRSLRTKGGPARGTSGHRRPRRAGRP